jgi:hypothetical protein
MTEKGKKQTKLSSSKFMTLLRIFLSPRMATMTNRLPVNPIMVNNEKREPKRRRQKGEINWPIFMDLL